MVVAHVKSIQGISQAKLTKSNEENVHEIDRKICAICNENNGE